MFVLYVIAGAIVLVLGGIAAYYQWKLRQLNIKRKAQFEELEKVKEEKRVHAKKSIIVLCRALVEGQVTLTEASIRISVLLESLQVDQEIKEKFSAFYQLAEATKHIPILDQWKKLPSAEKKAFDLEREKLEDKFQDFILASAKDVLDQKLLGSP